MFVKIIKHGVTDGRSILDVGAVVEYPDAVAASLIKGGYATEDKAPNGGNGNGNGDGELTPETAAKKLDKFKVDDLIALTVEHGVEIADGAKKSEIIDAIIAAGVYADILG